jgi:Uma2 family endonuclease
MKNAALQFTYADYLALPQAGPRYQLIDGDLIVSPSPKSRHQIVQSRLFLTVGVHVASHKLGTLLLAPLDVKLSEYDTVQPDILFVAEANRHRIGLRGILGAPDLVIEILSDDRDMDLDVKRKLYARHGVVEYWIVDPDANIVSVYRLQENATLPWRTFGANDSLTSPLLPGLAVDLTAVFAA